MKIPMHCISMGCLKTVQLPHPTSFLDRVSLLFITMACAFSCEAKITVKSYFHTTHTKCKNYFKKRDNFIYPVVWPHTSRNLQRNWQSHKKKTKHLTSSDQNFQVNHLLKKKTQLFASIWFWYDDLSWTILANGLTSTVPLVRDWQSYVDSSQMAGSCAQLLSKQHWRNTWDRGEVAHMQACPSL